MRFPLWKIAEGTEALPDPWQIREYVPFAWLDERLRAEREQEKAQRESLPWADARR